MDPKTIEALLFVGVAFLGWGVGLVWLARGVSAEANRDLEEPPPSSSTTTNVRARSRSREV